jgi:exfoliative toxin A/B
MAPMTAPDDHLLRKVAKSTPIPLAGLMLGLASTGNMVSDYRWFFGSFAVAILVLLVIKIIYDTKTIREELKNPAVVGIACTFPMGLAVMSTYLRPYYYDLAFVIWVTMMLIHLILMVYFTKAFIFKFDVRKALPSYFVVYVGFSVNAFIAPLYGMVFLGQVLFWFGFIAFLALLPPLLYRILIVKSLSEPLIPTIVIFASPASVCLFAYLRAYPDPESWMVYFLLGISLVLYVAILAILPRVLRLKFYPSYSSLTFPLVISAIATTATYQYLSEGSNDYPGLMYLSYFEIALAVIVVVYVLLRYMHHFLLRRYITTT